MLTIFCILFLFYIFLYLFYLQKENSSFDHRQLFNSQPFERSMAVKMTILQHLRPSIEFAVWYDCDVLFFKPGCVAEKMLRQPLDGLITAQAPIAIPFEFHVGSFAVKQGVSNSALQAGDTSPLIHTDITYIHIFPSSQDIFTNTYIYTYIYTYIHTYIHT